jgi:hypothetical protein
MKMHCERCHRQMRQVLRLPFSGEIVQDWHAVIRKREVHTVRVADFDPDICERCEDEVFKACEEAGLGLAPDTPLSAP